MFPTLTSNFPGSNGKLPQAQQQQQQAQQGQNSQQGQKRGSLGPNSGPQGPQGPSNGPQGPQSSGGQLSKDGSPRDQKQDNNQKGGDSVNKLVDKFESSSKEETGGKKELPIKTGPPPQQSSNQEHNQQQKNNQKQEKQGTKKELNRTDSRSQMSSKNSSRQSTPPQSSKSGTQMVRMSDSGCSPIGGQSPLEKQHFSNGRSSKGGGQQHSGRHDFQDDMPQPRKKTQIIYDLGSPETCTQGMNACIPVTTDKYTYTITSVLTTRSGSSTSPPLSPTSSLGGGPIASSRCSNKQLTARMGRSSPSGSPVQGHPWPPREDYPP